MASTEAFFKRLNRIFRSGPAIQRRIKGYDTKSYYNSQVVQSNYGYRAAAPFGFGRENSPFSVMGSYGLLDRMARYAEFSEMEYLPEIAAALDIYADEVVGGDDRGKVFHVFSGNEQIKEALDELFQDTLNVEFNLRMWTRNLCKYGDFLLYNEVLPDYGVVNATPIAVNEIEREEGFDLEDPYAVRFKWLTRGNKYLENWQVTHMRILGNDLFMPYGTSLLESSRRIHRQLLLLEDAMLTYRIVRSPERRVFYIDVGNIAPNEVPNYMEAAKATLRSRSTMDRETGREDQRMNSMSILDDYFIPVRGSQQGTRVETLTGGQHVTATEDVEYIQKKLFAALKVPKPYLNFDESLSAKASLAQMDVRFSRTIQGLQKIVISELNKLAMIHLFAKGFDGEDLINFELKLSNPSSVALQQKLELWSVKFDIGGTAKETKLVDEYWVQKHILEMTDDEIGGIEKGLRKDRTREMEIEAMELEEPDETQPPKTTGVFDPTNYQIPGKDVSKVPLKAELTGPNVPGQQPNHGGGESSSLSYSSSLETGKTPIKATPFLTRHKKNRVRRMGVGKGRQNTAMPNLAAMLSPKNKYNKDIHGQKTEAVDLTTKDKLEILDMDYTIRVEPKFDRGIRTMFEKMSRKGLGKKSGVLKEDVDLDIDIEILDQPENSDGPLIESIELSSENAEIESIEETSLAEVFKDES